MSNAIHIGFTGTRNGMTPAQLVSVHRVLCERTDGHEVTAHHGDCLGADAEFHRMVRSDPTAWIVGHLPVNDTDRAFCDFDEVRNPLPYMKRNTMIVRAADIMIAATPTMEELEYGGTWRTVGLARNAKKPLAICYPDGSVTREREISPTASATKKGG